SQRLSKEKAELVFRLKQDVEHYANQARAQELSSKRPNAQPFDVEAFKRRQKEFEKLRDEAQKRLNEALRDQPQPGSLLASTDPGQQKLRSDIEVVDLEMKIAELTGQRHEAKIAQDGASRSLSDSRGILTPKERQSLESEKLQGMAKIETLNRQLTLLNKKL